MKLNDSIYLLIALLLGGRITSSWAIEANYHCYEQHFCSCPPWLSVQRFDTSGHEVDIHFTKQNYNDQFAILGKSKELHCCVGPSYERLEWYKDGVKFPWHRNEGKDRNIILYSNNQSLIIMDVKKEDSGRFTCVAESGAGFRVSHTTRLESFPPPVFSHPPIWNSRPEDTMVTEGESVELVCSVTVGQQYNTVSMLPVYADWDWERNNGGSNTADERFKVSQKWSDDDIVIHLSLKITAAKLRDSGEYRCKVKNEYGVLEQRVALTVTPSDESLDGRAIRREMGTIFRKQLKLYSVLSRFTAKHQDTVQDVLRKAEKEWN